MSATKRVNISFEIPDRKVSTITETLEWLKREHFMPDDAEIRWGASGPQGPDAWIFTAEWQETA